MATGVAAAAVARICSSCDENSFLSKVLVIHPIMNTNMQARAKVNPGPTIHALASRRFLARSLQNTNGESGTLDAALPGRPVLA
jgi:hypothetical protein